MDTTKVAVGAVLIGISSVILLATSSIEFGVPAVLAGAAALAMAAGSLLVGTSGDGRAV